MYFLPHHSIRISLAGGIVVLAVAFAAAAHEETRVRHAEPNKQAGHTLTILPTLKGHMARLGSLMNFLFRKVDKSDSRQDVQETIAEMKSHLRTVGDRFVPQRIAAMTSLSDQSNAMDGFSGCIDGAIAMLDTISEEVANANYQEARHWLLALDSLRRTCHGAYAGE